MVADKSGKSGEFLFGRCVPDFFDGWRSFEGVWFMGPLGLKMAGVDLNHFGLNLKTSMDFTDLKKTYTGFKA